MTPCPVEDTSDFWTSSSLDEAFPVEEQVSHMTKAVTASLRQNKIRKQEGETKHEERKYLEREGSALQSLPYMLQQGAAFLKLM